MLLSLGALVIVIGIISESLFGVGDGALVVDGVLALAGRLVALLVAQAGGRGVSPQTGVSPVDASCSSLYQLVLLFFLLSDDFFEDVAHEVLQVSASVVLQDDRVEHLELLHFEVLQLVQLGPGQYAGQGLTDLGLDAYRDVLLHEVLYSVELVSFLIKFFLHFHDFIPHFLLHFLHNGLVLLQLVQ